jgi:hypothetical protein
VYKVVLLLSPVLSVVERPSSHKHSPNSRTAISSYTLGVVSEEMRYVADDISSASLIHNF